ncbi:MAG TPA: S46 family peptidase, partial [Steroidobacteraceae bacterium]|nr:S46 family peptidase [Steroidobacteraceae bacterium]
PEQDIGAFGGDPDNFQFPRWCLDMSILRIYENGKPVRTPDHLRIDFAGPQPGQPVFVAGHPGSTDRLLTLEELKTNRNAFFPFWLQRNSELRGRLIQFSKIGPEQTRITSDVLQGLENSIKVRRKQLDALLDDRLMAQKAAQEAELRKAIAADPELRAATGSAFEDMAKAQSTYRQMLVPYTFLEAGAGFNSVLYSQAKNIVRGTAERNKPNADRLREYAESSLGLLVQGLKAKTPVYPELERLKLSYSLERMREWLGPDAEIVRQVMGNESPDTLAAKLVNGSKLADPAVRMALWEGGAAAVAASDDPMIVLARSVDPTARATRKRYEDEVEAPTRSAAERIARARFKIKGTGTYPDATFTLRLNTGTVQGWVENGQQVEPFTQLSRLFERATGQPPFLVPDTWMKAKSNLDLSTRYNLSTNNDIVGGNSGSPLIDARGQIVGLMFDGNIHSISGSYWFDTEKNRAVAVHPAIMREALTKVYGADALFKEMSGKN